MRFGKKNVYQFLFIAAFGFLVLPTTIFAIDKTYEQAATPAEVVVVYNSAYTDDSDANGTQDSLQVANYYRDARLIPNQNIIGISATTTEAISRAVYEAQIKTPLESALTATGIATTTKYIVLVKGVPLKIKDSNPATGDYGQILTADYSSVDAAVCLLFEDYNEVGVISNPYFNDPASSMDYRFKNGFYSNATVNLNYLVTRLDGYSLADVLSVIDKSVLAYTASTKHFILDDHNKDYDSQSTAFTNLKLINGVTVNPDPWSDTTSFITTSTQAVVGYVAHGIHAGMPQNYYSTTLSLLEWSPGAVSVTYESYNALSLTNPAINGGQGQLAAFLAEGGSGGVGNVFEPYSSAIARERIWAPAYARGYNWADAAYMSMQYLDWVSVVVGDPLMAIADNVGSEVENVSAQINSDNKIELNWTNPVSDYSSSIVIRSTTDFPKNISEGLSICSGAITSCVDNSAALFTTYYYTVFALDNSGNYGRGLNSRVNISIDKNTAYFTGSPGTVSESIGLVSLRASFLTPVSGSKSLVINLSGSAVRDQDYTISTTTLNVINGSAFIDIIVNVLDNYIDNSNKNIVLTLEGSDYWAPISTSSYNLTINDNDAFGVSTIISDMNIDEGQVATRTVVLNSQPTHDVTFTFSTSTKYTLSSPDIVFTSLNWNSPVTYTVTANNDFIAAGNSVSALSFISTSSDSNYNGLNNSYSLVVRDVDVIGINADPVDLSITEGNSKALKIKLQTRPTDLVTINFIVGSGLSVDVSQLNFDSDDWATQKTVTVSAVNNSAKDGSRNVSLNLVTSTTDLGYLNISKLLTIGISDDEPSSGGTSSTNSGGGGGGGGGSSSPAAVSLPTNISAVNQSLVLESPTQAGSINKNFHDNSWVKLNVLENTVKTKTTFVVKNLEIFEVDLPVINKNNGSAIAAPINNMIIEVVATDSLNKEVEKFSNDLNFVFFIPQMASDDNDLSLYYYNENEKVWILISNAMFDKEKKMVYFSVNHLTKFAVFRNPNKEKVLAVASVKNETVPIPMPIEDIVKPVNLINVPSALPNVKVDKKFAGKQKGKILLQVEARGEAWYVIPKNQKRIYMANGEEAFKIMRNFGVGITNVNLFKFKNNKNLAKKSSGTIFLQVQEKGEAFYVGFDGVLYYLKNGAEAYNVMRKLGVGIKSVDLAKIEENK